MQIVHHYIQRFSQLGPLGSLQMFGQKLLNAIKVGVNAAWWGYKSRTEMSDSILLKQCRGQWTSLGKLLVHMANRSNSSFIIPLETPEEARAYLCEHHPEHISAVLSTADAACRNEFTLLDRTLRYPDGIKWTDDPETGWQWPMAHIGKLEKVLWSTLRPADLKPVWELNRHQYFVDLGISYWITGEKMYVDTFNNLLKSWIKANPLQHGVNWFSSLEVAIRIISWIMAFQFFRTSPSFRYEAGGLFLKSLFQHITFLSDHLSTWEKTPNNHLIGETAALALAGIVFPEFSKASDWREKGLKLICEQLTAQTYSDGVNKEQATAYHGFVMEFLILLDVLRRREQLPIPSLIGETLHAMLIFILYAMSPEGSCAVWGDADDGHAYRLNIGDHLQDARSYLSIGAVLFKRPDMKFAAGHFSAEAFWLLGGKGLKDWEELIPCSPTKTSHAFTQAGVYILRDLWTVNTDMACFRCGPFGLGGEGECAHAHCDLLSVLLWIAGRPILVDSGTYKYHGPERNDFRSTSAHNTLMVNGQEQAIPKADFAWSSVPTAECLIWEENRVVGAMQSTPKVGHWRELHHVRRGLWEITDHLEGEGIHDLSWFFHFSPDLILRWVNSSNNLCIEINTHPYVIVFPPTGLQVYIERGWYSSRYGHKQANPLLVATWNGEIPLNGASFTWKYQQV